MVTLGLWGGLAACAPSLDASVLGRHRAVPEPLPTPRIIEASAPTPPGWVSSPPAGVTVGRGRASTLDEARALATRDLSARIARALGVAVDARHLSVSSDAAARDVERRSIRVQGDLRLVEPDAEHWVRMSGAAGDHFVVHHRRRIGSTLDLMAQATTRAGAQPRVWLAFAGPHAAALAQAVFVGRSGSKAYRILDPALQGALRIGDASRLRPLLTPERVVRGRVAADAPAIDLEVEGGATGRVEANSWAELAVSLPSAVHHLLVGPVGGPAPPRGAR